MDTRESRSVSTSSATGDPPESCASNGNPPASDGNRDARIKEALFRERQDGELVADPQSFIISSANLAAAKLFGCEIEDLVGGHLLHILAHSAADSHIEDRLMDDGTLTDQHLMLKDFHGVKKPVVLWLRRLNIGHGEQVIVTTIRDDAENARLANTDPLTSLENRRSFDAKLRGEYLRMLRGHQPWVALLIVDLDHFKLVNDTYGHPVGDEVLRQASEALRRSAMRESDIVARIGGEEFAILLPGDDLKVALAIAKRVHQEMQKVAVQTAKGVAGVTCSIGVAAHQRSDAANVQEMVELNARRFAEKHVNEAVANFLNDADQAAYGVKRSGRNGTCFAEVEHNPLNGKRTLHLFRRS